MTETKNQSPVLTSMIIVAAITVTLMFFSKQIIYTYSKSPQKTQEYTSQQSYDSQKVGSVK